MPTPPSATAQAPPSGVQVSVAPYPPGTGVALDQVLPPSTV